MKLRAVIFDFDGTLADSYTAITASVNHVRKLRGLPPLSEAEVRRHVGRGPDHLIRQTVPGADLEKDWAHYRAHHPSVIRSGTRLLPGASEVLGSLKSKGMLLGVCSNKPRDFTLELIEHFGLQIDAVVGPEDVPRVKPAPDMLLTALQRLQVAASEALYIGDMVVDIETARGAGVTVWVVPTGSEERQALEAGRPDRMVEDLNEITRLFA